MASLIVYFAEATFDVAGGVRIMLNSYQLYLNTSIEERFVSVSYYMVISHIT